MSRSWYILHTYTGYEGKIERSIRSLLEKQEISSDVVLDVRVPVFVHHVYRDPAFDCAACTEQT